VSLVWFMPDGWVHTSHQSSSILTLSIVKSSDSEQACFAAMWLCINDSQRHTLHFLLNRLIRQNISTEQRNETSSVIDNVLHTNHLTDSQNVTVDTFMTLLRNHEAPGVRDLHLLAYRACVMMDDSVVTPTDASMHTLDDLSAEARSRDSGITTTESIGASHNSGTFPAILFESLAVVQVVEEGHGLPLGSFGTLSDMDCQVDCTGPAASFFGPSS
jgi:hypothetical protein